MSDSSNPFVIDIFTLFPSMFSGPLSESILRRARDRDLIRIIIHDFRDWATDRHRTADDTPYGGGAGMVMSAPLIVTAVESILRDRHSATAVAILSASGKPFRQSNAVELARLPGIALICGHYEGIDERVALTLNATQFAIGEAVLTGGELPAMMVVDAVSRLLPGVILAESTAEESFSRDRLEYPQFTRPPRFRGLDVPETLLSGNHERIRRWRRHQSLIRTAKNRPDLLIKGAGGNHLSSDEA